jgi:hypothetical protein
MRRRQDTDIFCGLPQSCGPSVGFEASAVEIAFATEAAPASHRNERFVAVSVGGFGDRQAAGPSDLVPRLDGGNSATVADIYTE